MSGTLAQGTNCCPRLACCCFAVCIATALPNASGGAVLSARSDLAGVHVGASCHVDYSHKPEQVGLVQQLAWCVCCAQLISSTRCTLSRLCCLPLFVDPAEDKTSVSIVPARRRELPLSCDSPVVR